MLGAPPVTTAAQAGELAAHFLSVMDELVTVVTQETELVRGGRLSAAGELAIRKSELTRDYIADTLLLRASHDALGEIVPALLADIRLRHDAFRELLQKSLTVLATAHAVSEGIVRGVSEELARKDTPQTYTAYGRANAPVRTAPRPLAVSRML
jgi:hypothetical protein